MRKPRHHKPHIDRPISRLKPKRRRFLPLLKKILVWNSTIALTIGGGLAVRGGLVQKTAHQSWQGMVCVSQFLGWNSKNLILEGRKTLCEKDMQDAIEFKVGEPLLAIDSDAIYRRLKKTPWIKNVSVKKIYPQTLHIKIEERQPYCCVLQKNKNVVVDRQGVVLLEGLESHLPKVKGFQAHLHAHELLDILPQHPAILSRIDYIERRRSGRFDLFFKDGLRIALPRINSTKALDRLDAIIASKLITTSHSIIDLRVPDKIIYTGKNDTQEHVSCVSPGGQISTQPLI